MTRRHNGDGSVYRRKDGRWAASVQVDGRRRTAYAHNEREARGKLRELRERGGTAAAANAQGRHTLADLVEVWLTSDPALRDTTKAATRRFLAACILPALGGVSIDRLTPEQLQTVYTGLTPSTARRAHAALHRALEVAVRWRWLADNPCKRVMLPSYTPAQRRMWSAADLQTFLTAIEGYWLAPLYVMLVSTGLRIGEALALTWDDAGLGVAVNVNGTLQWLDGQPVINPPKTRAGRRTVLLPPAAVLALQTQKAQQEAWREAAGAGWTETGHVFTKRDGRLLKDSTPHTALSRYCDRLGLPPCTLHGLRHLHASLLIQEGVPISAVSARLGHANPAITMRVYAHSLPGQDALAAAAIGRVIDAPVEVEAGEDG